VCLFGGTVPATRLAVIGFDPWFLTVARAAIAGAAGLMVIIATGKRIPPRSLWPQILGAAFCTVLGFPLCVGLAMATVPAAHAGVVLGILPLATAGAATVLAHERPSAGFWLASVAGSLIVLTFVAGAIGYTLSGRLTALMPGWEVISWQVILFLPFAALTTYVLWPSGIANVPASSWAGLAYVGFVSQYTAFFVFNAAMAMAGIARIGQIMLLQPFVVVVLALPVNGEPIRAEDVLFAAAVVATVLIGQRTRVARLAAGISRLTDSA
jgi:drug/metabolite transporter (DMT)-like permease